MQMLRAICTLYLKKVYYQPLTITITVAVQFQQFLVLILLREYATEMWFIFNLNCFTHIYYLGKLEESENHKVSSKKYLFGNKPSYLHFLVI